MTAYIENLVSLNLYRTAVDQTTIIAILCDNREGGTILFFRIFFILHIFYANIFCSGFCSARILILLDSYILTHLFLWI
jgi:hypothetical protein